MKKTTSRFMACLLVLMMLISALSVSVSADAATAALVETPENGDKVVIYYPAGNSVLGSQLSGSKLAAVEVTVSNNALDVTSDMGVFAFTKDDVTGNYYLIDANGKYLTSGNTGNSVSLADEKSDCALWSLEAAENGWYIKNYAAAYVAGETSKPQYLEYYNGFTTYSFNSSKVDIYTFVFYKVDGDVITDIPSDGPTDVVFSTIAEARNGESNVDFNVKGVVTFIDGKNVVVEDETGAINLYLTSEAEVSVGNLIAATGTRSAYSGLQQLKNASIIEVIEAEATIPAPIEVTLAEVLADQESETLESRWVVLKGVTLGETEENNTAITDDAGNTINIYKCPDLECPYGVTVGAKLDIIALVSDFNGYQLRVAKASDVTVVEGEGVLETPSEDTAKPGDSSMVTLFVILAVLSIATSVVIVKRKNA